MIDSLYRFDLSFVKNRTAEVKRATMRPDPQTTSRDPHLPRHTLQSNQAEVASTEQTADADIDKRLEEYMYRKRRLLFEDKINVSNCRARLTRLMAKDANDRKVKESLAIPRILNEKLQPWTTKDIDNFLLNIGLENKKETIDGLVEDETCPPTARAELMLYNQLLVKIRTHEEFTNLLEKACRETLTNALAQRNPLTPEEWKEFLDKRGFNRMDELAFLENFIKLNVHPGELLEIDRLEVPLKEAVDVLMEKYEIGMLLKVFKDLGLDIQALKAEYMRRNPGYQFEELRSNPRLAKKMPPPEPQTPKEELMKRIIDGDKRAINENTEETARLATEGKSLSKLIRKSSFLITQGVNEIKEAIDHVRSKKRISIRDKPVEVDTSNLESALFAKVPQELAAKFKVQIEANKLSRESLMKQRLKKTNPSFIEGTTLATQSTSNLKTARGKSDSHKGVFVTQFYPSLQEQKKVKEIGHLRLNTDVPYTYNELETVPNRLNTHEDFALHTSKPSNGASSLRENTMASQKSTVNNFRLKRHKQQSGNAISSFRDKSSISRDKVKVPTVGRSPVRIPPPKPTLISELNSKFSSFQKSCLEQRIAERQDSKQFFAQTQEQLAESTSMYTKARDCLMDNTYSVTDQQKKEFNDLRFRNNFQDKTARLLAAMIKDKRRTANILMERGLCEHEKKSADEDNVDGYNLAPSPLFAFEGVDPTIGYTSPNQNDHSDSTTPSQD